jgi:hypothetical protein
LGGVEGFGCSVGELSGGLEVNFFALVSPHSSPLPYYAFLLVGEASKQAFEAHHQIGNGAAALLSSRVLLDP